MPPPEDPGSTAIYDNRKADKQRVETQLGLPEQGDAGTRFFTNRGTLFAVGYARVVYGDHGPYVEFTRDNIRTQLVSKFNRPLPKHCFYEWLIPTDGSNLKVYDQKKTVALLKNPPPGGFAGNRPEGYADYRIGMLYVAPFDFGRIHVEPQTQNS